MKTGLYISGIGHAVLILWLLFGGLFLPAPEDELLQVSQVSILSEAEFAALSEPVNAAPVTSPSPPSRPAPSVPEATPEPVSEPEPVPEPTPVLPPEPEVQLADIDRVAPEAAPEPEPLIEVAPEETTEVAPDETGEQTQPEVVSAAPEAATTEIVTEATETVDLAPTTSPRPPARPTRPVQTPEPDPEVETDPESIPTGAPVQDEPASEPVLDAAPDVASDPVADAIAQALAEATAQSSAVPSGPPLSQGEMRALQVSVGNCWNVGSLSSEALRTTVVVGVDMTPDGKPELGSIRMVSFTGGGEAAARRAYETARRAIIRCGAAGYNLPSEKYEQWREIEMTFNPENMRIK